MFGFLAAFGPVGIAAAVVGTVGAAAYSYLKDDEDTINTNTSDNCHHASKNDIIKNEIKNYKMKQKKRIKEKYHIDIKFVTEDQKKNTTLKVNESTLGNIRAYTNDIPNDNLGVAYGIADFVSLNKDKKRVIILDDELNRFNQIKEIEDEIEELSHLSKELMELKNDIRI